MSQSTYNSLAAIVLTGVLIAFVVMVVSFVWMIVRWKTIHRRRHVIRLLLATAAIPCLVALQQVLLWKVYLPALGREQMAQMNALRKARMTESSLVEVGDPVPSFSITTADGEGFTLPNAKGQVVVISFFATWCGPCQLELPHLEKIWSKHRNHDNFRLLVIGREESVESVREFRADKGFSFPIAADPDRSVYSKFALELIPRTLVVSPAGDIVYSQAGFHEEDVVQLKAVIEEQLAALR